MATDPYADYRFNPATAANPYATLGSPAEYGAPSDSLWGGYLDRSGLGAGKGFGLAQTALNPMAGLTLGLGTGMWRDIFEADNPVKALGDLGTWKNITSFGRSNARKEREAAETARRIAVETWRRENMARMGGLLGQAGSDVRRDLEGELRQAMYTGGDMLADPNQLQDAMTKFQQRYQQYMLGRQRGGQARQVDAMFNDPRRASERQRRLGAERTRGLQGIAESYRIGQRENAFNQARRGVQGSSMDVEQQGRNARGRDMATRSLQAGLDAKAQQYRLNDMQQRNQLMGLIYSDDPNTAAALSRTLEGINQQGALVRENEAVRAQGEALDRATSQNYSQAVGGLLSSASRPMEYYLSHAGSGA